MRAAAFPASRADGPCCPLALRAAQNLNSLAGRGAGVCLALLERVRAGPRLVGVPAAGSPPHSSKHRCALLRTNRGARVINGAFGRPHRKESHAAVLCALTEGRPLADPSHHALRSKKLLRQRPLVLKLRARAQRSPRAVAAGRGHHGARTRRLAAARVAPPNARAANRARARQDARQTALARRSLARRLA